jgi:hypothetical protein
MVVADAGVRPLPILGEDHWQVSQPGGSSCIDWLAADGRARSIHLVHKRALDVVLPNDGSTAILTWSLEVIPGAVRFAPT